MRTLFGSDLAGECRWSSQSRLIGHQCLRLSRRRITFFLLGVALVTPLRGTWAHGTNISSIPSAHATQGEEPFAFTPIDQNLLAQADLLDQELEDEGLIYVDEALTTYIDGVGKSVVPVNSPLTHVRWRFRVLRDPLANAFALPNGSIYVTCGLLTLLENESQLAGVLAHESSHVLGRHAYIQNRSIRKKALAANVLQIVATLTPAFNAIGRTISVLASSAQTMLVYTVFGYSRELEKEADIYAVKRLQDSDYDPKEMIRTFRLLESDYEAELVAVYYRDHPKLEERIAYTDHAIQNASERSISSDTTVVQRIRYLSNTEKVARHTIELELANRRFRTALAFSRKLVEYNPKSSENLTYLADSYSLLGARTIEPSAEELSLKGRRRAMSRKQKLTPTEEDTSYMETSTGQAALKQNLANAEEQYENALDLDNNNARAHFGLGTVFEADNKPQQAMEEYKKSLAADPDGIPSVIIERRLRKLARIAPPRGPLP